MSGSFFPGVLPFSAMDGGTVSLDGESLTAANETIRSPWVNAGTLARVRWELESGTFTDVRMRSSASLPKGQGDHTCLDPGVFNATGYDPAFGTLPSASGWSNYGMEQGATILPNGILYEAPTGSSASWQTYPSNGPNMQGSGHRRFIATHTFKIPEGVGNGWGVVVAWRNPEGTVCRVPFGVNNDTNPERNGRPYLGATNSTPALIGPSVRGQTVQFTVLYDADQSLTTAKVYFDVLPGTEPIPVSQQTLINSVFPVVGGTLEYYFGYYSHGTATPGGQQCELYFIGNHLEGPEWETVTNGDTSFAALDRGYVQLKGTLDGTLTKLDLANDLTAPDDLTVTATPGANGVITALASPPDSGNVLYWERTGPSTSASEYASDERAYAWSDCEDGEHTVSVRQATPDGVLSVNAATATPTLPATPPSVTITGPGDPVQPGSDIEVDYATDGGVDLTINGISLSGSGTAVIGSASSGTGLIGPTAPAPILRNHPAWPRPILRWSDDTMLIKHLAEWNTIPPATLTLYRRAEPGGTTYTQVGSPVAYGDLAFNVTLDGDDFAGDHGWTIEAGYAYAIVPTYADGSTGPRSADVIPNDRADYEVTVTGQVDEQWAGKSVTVTLRDLVTAGGQAYLRAGYLGTVASDGTWAVAGLPIGGVATVKFPDNNSYTRALPETPGAVDFAGLSEPA